MIANIQLDKDKFTIFFNNIPQSSVKFQIKYYNFSEIDSENGLVYIALKTNVNFENLITFLKENNIHVNLCHNSQDYLNNIFEEKAKTLKRIENLKNIKENISDIQLDKLSSELGFLKRPLKKTQLYSCYHLLHSKSAANFSVPGSGKTSVVLAYYEKLKREKKVDAIFLIGPKNCYYSWKTEFFANLGRDPKLCILDKKPEDRLNVYKNPLKSEIYACHFITNSNDIESLKIFSSNNRFLLVIDEAHNIKKIDGKWSKAALELGKLSEYKVVLTGTPMPNQHKDFYNYLDFLYGENEIMSAHDKAKIDVYMERGNIEEASRLLREKINPFYVRVAKKDLHLSKQVFNKPILIEMNPVEKKIYDAIISKIKNYPNKKYEHNIELIKKIRRARILRLRQNCSYVKNLITAIPENLREGDENLTDGIGEMIASYDKHEIPAKITTLKRLVLPIAKENRKVLIWSTHLKTIELIRNHLSNEGISIKSITGETKLDIRENIKDEFNDKSSGLTAIIANPQACSESISLHKACRNAIYYDQNYNTAEFVQSLDRIHRVGGSEEIQVHYDFLQYENSVDEKVYKRVFDKANKQMKVIEQENLMFDLEYEDDYSELYNDLRI